MSGDQLLVKTTPIKEVASGSRDYQGREDSIREEELAQTA